MKTTLSILCLGLYAAGSHAAIPETQQIGELSQLASDVIQRIPDERDIVYINMNDLLKSSDITNELQYTEIENNVLNSGKKYFIDLSDIIDTSEKNFAHNFIKNIFGITFPNDVILITEYKDSLSFSPIDSADSPLIEDLDAEQMTWEPEPWARTSDGSTAATLPIKTYFIKINEPISRSECTFPRSTLFPYKYGSVYICGNNSTSPHITLNYKISYMRSKPLSNSSGTTPDQKLVRVSLDEDAGAGILLNDVFRKEYSTVAVDDGSIVDGWILEFLSSGIAQYYNFNVLASNKKASILKTFPSNNLNSQTSTTDVSGFEIGATAKADVSLKDGPTVGAGASASYSEQRRFTYKTADYKVIRTPYSGQKIGFKWEREQYATADSIRNIFTTDIFQGPYPVDTNLVNEIGYRGFVPNFDVVFGADPDMTGSTSFSLESSVGIKPTYHRLYRHFVFHSYQGHDVAPRNVTISNSFTVDWDAAIFKGAFPVYLQLGGDHDNSCLSVASNGTVGTSVCNKDSTAQSFIYDKDKYISVAQPTKCLDSSHLSQLSTCSDTSFSQKWRWDKNKSNIFTDVLRSQLHGETVALTHDLEGNLTVEKVKTATSDLNSQQMATGFTDLW